MPRSAARSQITHVLGEAAAQKLFESYGGKRLYVPTIPRLSREHPIVHAIGLSSALLLSQEWGGLRIDIPVSRNLAERNQRILQARSTMPRSDMVAYFRLSRRRIDQILAAQ